MNDRPLGPYIAAALFAERVIEEKDNTKSLIRVVDRLTQTAVGAAGTEDFPPDEMPPMDWSASAFISLKPGTARGRQTLRIISERPDGIRQSVQEATFNFRGEGNQGVDVVIAIHLHLTMAGLYWFDVEIDGRVLTRMPLEVLYERRVMQLPPPAPGQ